MKKRILIVIPAYNEAQNLGAVLDDLERCGGLDIVVVDDASADDTRETSLAHGAVVLPLLIRLGAWGATQTGIRYGVSRGYEVIVTMDADGQHHPEYIPRLLDTMKTEQADVVVGSCPVRCSRARHIAWCFFRVLSGVKLEDLTSGLKAYSSQAASHLVNADATIFDYQDLGVMLYLLKNDMRIVECDVEMGNRGDGGKSKIFNSWLLVLKYMIQTTILCLSMRRVGKKTVLEGESWK